MSSQAGSGQSESGYTTLAAGLDSASREKYSSLLDIQPSTLRQSTVRLCLDLHTLD